MINSSIISNQEIQELGILSDKINKLEGSVEDFNRYEVLLKKAGLKEDKIRSRMKQYGYLDYEDLVDGQKSNVKEQKDIVNIYIISFFVALFGVALYLYSKKKE